MVVARGLGLRCAITGLSTGSAATALDAQAERRLRLREQVRRWAAENVDYVQLREKTLDPLELLQLAETALASIESTQGSRTQLLINGRMDLALAAGAAGVQLTARTGELLPEQVRRLYERAGRTTCIAGVSCHTLEEVRMAREQGADLVLFGPVFEKRVAGEVVVAGAGLELLRKACGTAGGIPVLALGGVTAENAPACRAAGAAGLAGIRTFL